MTRSVTVIDAMLSSPGDMQAERQVVEDVISELNRMWRRSPGVQVHLFRWEIDATPGVAPRPQEVINREAGDDYDLFIGLLGTRFGTPTGEAMSGTEEEFRRAFRRYTETGRPEIMLYFSERPISPSTIDLEQLARVAAFRQALSEKGILYRTFNSSDELASLLRLNLSSYVRRWFSADALSDGVAVRASGQASSENTVDSAESIDLGLDDEPGFLDLAEAVFSKATEFEEVMTRMTEAVRDVGNRMIKRTQEMERLGPLHDAAGLKRAKAVVLGAATDLSMFTRRLSSETPLFASTFGSLISAYTSLFKLASSELTNAELPSVEQTLQQAKELAVTVQQSYDSTKSFRDSLLRWPSVSTYLNKARREAIGALDALLGEFKTAGNLIQEVIDMLTGALDAVKSTNG